MRIVRALEAFYRACPRLTLCLAAAAVLSGVLLPAFMLASGALVAAVEREAADPALLRGLTTRGPTVLRGRDTPIELWAE